jgi:hypothetical protein
MTVTPFDSSKSISFITYDNRNVSYYTPTNMQAGLYNITQNCTVNTLTPSTVFTYFVLTVIESCSGSSYDFSIIASKTFSDLKYRVGEGLKTLSVSFQVSNTTYCSTSDFQYTWTVNSSIQTIYKNPANKRITNVNTNDTNDIGNYTVTITGTITTQS